MSSHFAIDRIVGNSEWTSRLRRRIVQIANYHYSVLITGPSGTGKELVARAIHEHGPRREKPFVPVNCAAVSGSLFTSQLFGHTKGAFTGAQYAALGCFRAADGGSIFLDEISELDPDCQAKLLRVLQDRLVVPLGAHEGHPVDVRVIAASNRDLEDDVREGRFRLDLFYRLNILPVQTVRLAERIEDIPPLARHFLAKTAIESGLPLKRLSEETTTLLQSYRWPGNVRELQNHLERAVVFAEGETLHPQDFPQLLDAGPEMFLLGGTRYLQTGGHRSGGSIGGGSFPAGFGPGTATAPSPSFSAAATLPHQHAAPSDVESQWLSLAELEAQHIRATLEAAGYNQSAAARMLGIDRKLLARKIKKHRIGAPANPPGRPKGS